MKAKKFLKSLSVHDPVFDSSDDYEYTEEQLLEFAEKYAKHSSEPDKITCQGTINTGELSEETKKQLENIVWVKSENKNEYMTFRDGRKVEIPKIGITPHSGRQFSKSFFRSSEALSEALNKLNQSPNKPKMEKKIIGYKLKDKKYKKFADKLVDTKLIGNDSNTMDFNLNGMWFIKFREAGVLDLWFNPVYEEEKTILPVIEGYEGKDCGASIKYGCKEVFKSTIQDMQVLGIGSFKVNVYEGKVKISNSQMQQIYDYINNQ